MIKLYQNNNHLKHEDQTLNSRGYNDDRSGVGRIFKQVCLQNYNELVEIDNSTLD